MSVFCPEYSDLHVHYLITFTSCAHKYHIILGGFRWIYLPWLLFRPGYDGGIASNNSCFSSFHIFQSTNVSCIHVQVEIQLKFFLFCCISAFLFSDSWTETGKAGREPQWYDLYHVSYRGATGCHFLIQNSNYCLNVEKIISNYNYIKIIFEL